MVTSLEVTESNDEHIEFGVNDSKGREVGVLLVRSIDIYTEKPEPNFGGYCQAPGTYFSVDAHATRNGKRFGASHRDHCFVSADAREAWISRRVESARKREVKRYSV